MRLRMVMTGAALLMALAPLPAQAQAYVTPYVGLHAGGAADASIGFGEADTKPWNLGVTGGWRKGWLGADADLGWYPRFFDRSGGFMTNTSLMTLMGNGRVMVPWHGFQPFATAGIGILRPNVAEAGGLAVIEDTKFGWNVGGGAVAMLSPRVGIQGEVRYIRAMESEDAEPNPFGIDFDEFDFTRATVGVTFTW